MTAGCWAAHVIVLLAAVRVGFEIGSLVHWTDLSWTARLVMVVIGIWVPLGIFIAVRDRPFQVADGALGPSSTPAPRWNPGETGTYERV